MLIENCEICNFADDNTFYSGEMELSSILEYLKTQYENYFKVV